MATTYDSEMASPSESVIRAFGGATTHDAATLSGGDETSLVIGNIVFKLVTDPRLAQWSQATVAAIAATGPTAFRVPDPIATGDGNWVVDGWTATRFVPNLTPGLGRWAEVARAGKAFSVAAHIAAAGLDAAPVRARTDRWAVADRFVWDEISLTLSDPAQALVNRLRALAPSTPRPPMQVIHADLTGNVFFDIDDIPTVIDFSPLIRPLSHAPAIVAGDALLWHHAQPDDVLPFLDDPRTIACALMFRLVSEQLGDNPRHGARVDDYERVLHWLAW